MCFTRLLLRNHSNSSETNCGPLSDTSCSGRPYAANNFRNSLMVAEDVVVLISMTSGHFEWASTTISRVRPLNGPAKSTWMRREGQTHGCMGATGGALLTLWH